MAIRAALGLLAIAGVGRAGIYPSGHFDTVKKITTDNMDATVKTAVDAGKTLFAPAWNEIAGKFAENSDVEFGDVNLSEDQVRESHGEQQSPGSGGWPTIRYFNKETGYGGKPYDKKTNSAMCDELGDTGRMQDYIEEAGGTSLCAANKPEMNGCNEKSKTFIGKWKAKSHADIVKEHGRLEKMGKDSTSVKPEALQWQKARVGILKQLSAAGKDEL